MLNKGMALMKENLLHTGSIIKFITTLLVLGSTSSAFTVPSTRFRKGTLLHNLPLPFFASLQTGPKEGTASVTTRLPLGTIFDSRDYIFSTATNVRSYEWTAKEAEELLDDLMDASKGILSGDPLARQDYELSQIVLVPMEWDRDIYGLGQRYDVYDGQQRLVTLCILFAALRDSFARDKNMEETTKELANMLNPPKTRKADVSRIELHRRDNEVLQLILTNEIDKLEKINLKGSTRANQQILSNYQLFINRMNEVSNEDRLKLLDFMIENTFMLVCVPESATIARNIVMGQGKGKDNEPIDDFKGITCFRYTTDEDKMYKTFDAWDKLQAPMDLDNGSVGRNTVADASVFRATADLGEKIRKSDQINSLERWLRQDIMLHKHEGHAFFRKKIEPASLLLGQFREGNFNLFGFYARSKNTKIWHTIVMRLRFLRELTISVSSTKDVEFLVLELLLRANASEGEKPLAMTVLDQYLQEVEILAMWMALTRTSASQRSQKCFALLKTIRSGETEGHCITQEDKSSLREALVVNEFGATPSGKKLVMALLKRLNEHLLVQNGSEAELNELAPSYLESILPSKASVKAWGKSFPDSKERDQWINRVGNLVLTSNKATTRESRSSFSDKKIRFQEEIWPLTQNVAKLDDWNSDNLVKHLAYTVSLIDSVWGL